MGVGGRPLSLSYIPVLEFGISRLENPLNSKECNNILGVMQNNIFNSCSEILMQVINQLTVPFKGPLKRGGL